MGIGISTLLLLTCVYDIGTASHRYRGGHGYRDINIVIVDVCI